MTTCRARRDFQNWAKQQGYPYCVIVDWHHDTGTWTFIVSADKETWYLMTQESARPRLGFCHSINLSRPYKGTAERVLEIFEALDILELV